MLRHPYIYLSVCLSAHVERLSGIPILTFIFLGICGFLDFGEQILINNDSTLNDFHFYPKILPKPLALAIRQHHAPTHNLMQPNQKSIFFRDCLLRKGFFSYRHKKHFNAFVFPFYSTFRITK